MALLAGLVASRAEPSRPSEFPIERRGGLIWLKVTVPESMKPLNFLLDSGAAASVIHLRTATRLGVKLGRPVEVRGVGGSAGGFWPQRLHASIGDVALPKNFLAVDLAELSRACECGVDGLLGADFFRGRIVQIDLEAGKVRLLASHTAGVNANVVKLKLSRNVMLAAVGVDDRKPQWMRVDTGCASPLQWVAGNRKPAHRIGGVSVGLTELNIDATTTTVRLGALTFDSVPTGLHRRPIFAGESGLLGNGLLTRFGRVTFDGKAGRLVLEGRREGK
jgi:hypothetical protein